MKPFQTFLFVLITLSIVLLFRNKDLFIPEHNVNELVDSIYNNDSVFSEDFFLNQNEHENSGINSVPFFENIQGSASLYKFFNKLRNCNDTLARIVWFGDSQVEGDFFTSAFRNQMQERFGGSGIGFMPVQMYFNSTKKVAVITNDFEGINVFEEDSSADNSFGLYGHYFRPKEKLSEVKIKNREGHHQFNYLKLLYSGSSKLNFTIGNESHSHALSSIEVVVDTFRIQNSSKTFELSFYQHNNFKLYGLLFDAAKGIAIDHVAFRGSLNLKLNKYNGNVFGALGEQLNPALVVLQFGLNVIPGQRENYLNYQKALERDITLLKKYLPNVSVLVIGAPDMAHKVRGELVAYSNIDRIIEAQRNAAHNQNCAFWDLRSAMGGEGASIKWLEHGYIRSDYAHITATGAQLVTDQLFADLMQAYTYYLSEND